MTTEILREIFAGMKPLDVAIIVSATTGQRTTVLEDVTEAEAEKILRIYRPQPTALDAQYNALKEQVLIKEWRSKILANAEKAGIKKPGSFHDFNNWMLKSGRFKKQLTAHTLEELKELHKQVRALMQNNARSAQKPMTRAWFEKGNNLKQWN